MLDQIIELIEQFDTICIYRHILPDGDAKGSQFGMKSWIESKYPNKKVVALGKDTQNSFFPDCDQEKIDFSKALAIICDTSNRERIDGEGWEQCAKVIKIDHHPVVDSYGDLNIVDDTTCAACEVIAQMLMDHQETLTLETATYLYCGLLTDSQRFSIPTVSERSLRVASYLVSFGVDIQKCNLKMFSVNLKEYEFENYLRNKVIYKDSLAYIVASKEDYEKFDISFEKAKEKVNVMANVEEIESYVLYTEQPEGNYSASFRSKRTVLNDIAAHFGGGGHNFASGAKNLTLEDIQKANQELIDRMHESQK